MHSATPSYTPNRMRSVDNSIAITTPYPTRARLSTSPASGKPYCASSHPRPTCSSSTPASAWTMRPLKRPCPAIASRARSPASGTSTRPPPWPALKPIRLTRFATRCRSTTPRCCTAAARKRSPATGPWARPCASKFTTDSTLKRITPFRPIRATRPISSFSATACLTAKSAWRISSCAPPNSHRSSGFCSAAKAGAASRCRPTSVGWATYRPANTMPSTAPRAWCSTSIAIPWHRSAFRRPRASLRSRAAARACCAMHGPAWKRSLRRMRKSSS